MKELLNAFWMTLALLVMVSNGVVIALILMYGSWRWWGIAFVSTFITVWLCMVLTHKITS